MKVSDNDREIIYIVDDGEINLEIAKAILGGDYIIQTVLSGEKLFDLINILIPDLILLDIEMPGMDGYAVIEKLKNDEDTAHIPVIFLTGATDLKSELRALSMGAVDYITKPFSVDILKMRVGLQLLLQRQKRELQISVTNAEIANNTKSSFIAVMSHEMRTPLNAIIGFSELSLEAAGLSEELYSNLVNIKRAGTTLLSIISDILDISKIETGKYELIPTEYDTAGLISDALTQSIIYKNEKPIEFSLSIDDHFPARLFGDELRVKQILNNLLTNAFKYTLEGEVKLTVACHFEGSYIWVYMSVGDTGVGISQDDLQAVFDDYVQADMSANRKIVGTGLGLSISRRLARMMDGDIETESEYGMGSIFTARIKQRLVSDKPISSEALSKLVNFRYIEHDRNVNLPQMYLPYARILVVDDVEINLEVAVGLLKRYRINADCVSSGPEAVEAIRSEIRTYNAIFMDHMMPGMDGIEAVRLIREIDSDYARDIPIIAFTANAIVGNKEMFLENGFQAFISKPIELAVLDAIIREWVRDESREAEEICDIPTVSAGRISLLKYELSGVDFYKGLERFGGDENVYMDVMRSFAKNIPAMLEKAEMMLKTDMHAYTTLVHGIKGSCYGICADKTADMAEALERASKEGNNDYVIANNATFIENVRGLLLDIGELITKNEEKSKKDKPEKELLQKILDACERHDMNEIDEIAAELDSFEYEEDGDLVSWLREMADEMNYGDIVERLKSIL